VNDDRRSADEHRDDDGTPHVWNPDWLLRPQGEFDDGVVMLPRYESVFGPMAQPVRWS
jgi:hypothetical protein